jgi:hypothetical protein
MIPCKPRKGKKALDEAAGYYSQIRKYPDWRIKLKISAEHKGSRKVLRSITMASPRMIKTDQSIHIGSAQVEVIRVYGRHRDAKNYSEKNKNSLLTPSMME